MDVNLVLSLDHESLARDSHAPGAVLASRCHGDQDRQGPCPHKAVTIATLERLFWNAGLNYEEALSRVSL